MTFGLNINFSKKEGKNNINIVSISNLPKNIVRVNINFE